MPTHHLLRSVAAADLQRLYPDGLSDAAMIRELGVSVLEVTTAQLHDEPLMDFVRKAGLRIIVRGETPKETGELARRHEALFAVVCKCGGSERGVLEYFDAGVLEQLGTSEEFPKSNRYALDMCAEHIEGELPPAITNGTDLLLIRDLLPELVVTVMRQWRRRSSPGSVFVVIAKSANNTTGSPAELKDYLAGVFQAAEAAWKESARPASA